MKRRSFLKALAGLGALPFVGLRGSEPESISERWLVEDVQTPAIFSEEGLDYLNNRAFEGGVELGGWSSYAFGTYRYDPAWGVEMSS